MQLDNLILIYDDNQVTYDGPLDWTNSEDTDTKMKASDWEVIDVAEDSYDVQSIVTALEAAKSVQGKPVFVHVRTIIGIDTSSTGTAKAHHGPFDVKSIKRSKLVAGILPDFTHEFLTRLLTFTKREKYMAGN